MELLQGAFVYLMAMVVAVPLAKRLGMGSVLGYLLAGIVIGPALGIVGAETEQVKHFAEFGVVMMLFLIGLELQPAMLWRMRSRLLGLGGLQVLITALLIFGAVLAAGFPWQSALAIGMILALSSTAIVLQTLEEKGLMKTPPGESIFSVLLFQDIAVIPMLAALPLLAVAGAGEHGAADAHHGGGLDHLPGWMQALAILAVIAAIILAGRYLMRPVFRFIAEARLREIFSAAALLLVVGIALAMEQIGLSPALGTFLAGVVLSGSEYRHELESDIAPFKGLLLGVFFISVGAGIDFNLLTGRPGLILGLAGALMALKLVVLLILGRSFGLKGAGLWMFGLGLAQAGEFAFVLFGFAGSAGVLGSDITQVLTLAVAITMLLTPLSFILYERVIAPRAGRESDREADEIDEPGTAIIAGVGRFGQIVNRMLLTTGHKTVVLDHDPGMIDMVRQFGVRSYYGDATRPDLLEAASGETATLLVAALDDREKQNKLVEHVARNHPHCRIIARALDRHHVYELEAAGAHHVERELFEGSLSAGRRALIELGAHPFKAELQARAFRDHDYRTLEALRENWLDGGMDASYVDATRARSNELDRVMQSDRMAERHDTSERGWVPPPKGDAIIREK
jgi:CPA2 family monovalent cation:H+ antiporter-2/glutathione-regulated potassium-efflux system ancillary protein KefC